MGSLPVKYSNDINLAALAVRNITVDNNEMD